MGFLDQFWDETVAGPFPDSGPGKLRKKPSFGLRPNSGKESDGSGGSVTRSYSGEATTEETQKVTRSIMIVRPPGYQNNGTSGTPPASPAGSTPPVSPFSGKSESFRFRRRSMSDAYEKTTEAGPRTPTSPYGV
ncbi:hypothetical protein OIU77_003838 [Salix suchowensis]|uniref:Dormancy/auxin associated family protein n=1 Tax=Salix suchowensis TaxID=1278906 RepID=A0ABQ9ATK6_9ROSI|nr:dormancy-associated protein [Salix suchowensis]KAJ6359710.1 hypothetical protein OIU77_003838 [Salix suchowensis]